MRESFTVIAAETLYSRTSSAKQKIRPDSEKPKHHRKIQNPERGFKEKKKTEKQRKGTNLFDLKRIEAVGFTRDSIQRRAAEEKRIKEAEKTESFNGAPITSVSNLDDIKSSNRLLFQENLEQKSQKTSLSRFFLFSVSKDCALR